MQEVLSTYRILMKKAFNEDIDESWVEWALEMMEAGGMFIKLCHSN